MTPGAQDLIDLRVQQATESLTEARLLLEKGMRRGAMDRVYFTMFYCACALLATKVGLEVQYIHTVSPAREERARWAKIVRETGARID